MRIVTWNCCGGECRRRADLIPHADIVVLQECTKPTLPQDDGQCVWFQPPERKRRSVGVVARGDWRVARGPVNDAIPWVYQVRVSGQVKFHMLAVWGQETPHYVACIMAGLAAYEKFLGDAKYSVVVGDFNSHTCFAP